MKQPLSARLLAPVGYLWGVALALGAAALFFSLSFLPHELAQLPFMRLHPAYSGGEIAETAVASGVEWRIHSPVFDGLVGRRSHGFIQIDVVCKAEPVDALERDFDYDRDGKPDFRLVLPSRPDEAPTLENAAPSVTGVKSWARTKDGWIVRVAIKKL